MLMLLLLLMGSFLRTSRPEVTRYVRYLEESALPFMRRVRGVSPPVSRLYRSRQVVGGSLWSPQGPGGSQP